MKPRHSAPFRFQTSRIAASAVAIVFSHFAAPLVSAITYYWDDNAAAANFGTAGTSTGTWAGPTAGPTAGWSQSGTGASAFTAYTTTTSDALNFGNGATGLGAGTITLSGTVAAGSLTFATGTGNITLTGGTINLAAAATITTNASTHTIASLITGATTSLTKAGANTLKITGNNVAIAGGNLNINAGELQVGTDADALGGADGWAVQLGNTSGSSAATLTLLNSLNVPNPITVRLNTSATKKLTNGSGNINSTFSGAITADDNLTITQDTAPSGTPGSLNVNNANNTVVSGKTVTFSLLTVATLTDSSTWGGAGKLAYSGSGNGTINVTGAKTHSGGSTLGTMSGTGVVVINTSSTGPANAPTNGPFGTGTLTIGATKVRSKTGSDTTVGNPITFAGAPTFPTIASEKSLIFTGDASLVATRILTVETGSTVPGTFVEFGGIISGSTFGITKAGAGTLNLSGANSYTGATTVNAGTLTFSGSGSSNTSSGITVNGATAKLLQTSSAAVTPTVTHTLGTVTGNGTINTVNVANNASNIISNNNGVAGASLTIGALTFNGAATVNTFHNSNTAPIVTTSLATTVATTVTINASATSWTDGVTYDLISYTGSYAGGGIGQFVLGPVPNRTARQTANLINTGTALAMTITGDTPYWTGDTDNKWNTTTANNWKLLSNNNPALFLATDNVLFDDNASGAGPITVDIDLANVATNSTTFNNPTKDYVLTSTGGFGISAGFLTKNGNAKLTINNANTYTGGTTVNAGTLVLGNANAIGTGTLTLAGGNLDSSVANLVNAGNNAQAWNSDFTFVGTENLDLGTGAVTMSADRIVTVTANTLTIGGAIGGGAVGLTKSGAGTLNLKGVHTFTGTVAVNTGTLALSPSAGLTMTNTITGAAAINANPGTTNISLNGNLSGFTGTINVAPPVASPGKLTTGLTSSLASGAIVNIASGATWFTNNVTQTGITVNVSGVGNGEGIGALRTDTGTFDNTSSIVLQANSTIGGSTSTNTGTINAVISQNVGPFSLTKVGTNNIVLGAANTYSGPTVISGGVLLISAANNLGDGSATNTITTGTATLRSTANTYDLGTNRAITLTGSGKVQADAGTLTLSGTVTNGANLFTLFGAGNINVSGVIGAGATPTGDLNIGSTTLPANVTLSGDNLFTGNVSLPANNTQPLAVLTLTHSGALGVGPKTVTSLGSDGTDGGQIHLQNNISLASDISFTISGFTIYNDSGSNTINGNIAMAGGAGATYLTSTSGTLTINGNMSASTTSRELRLRGDGNGVIAGIISNGSTANLPVLKDSGTSTWTLTETNTYTGATTVSTGTLALGATGSIATSSAVSLGAAGTLDTSLQTTYAIPAAQPLAFGINATASGTSGKIAAAGLNITDAVVTYNITGTPDDAVYVLATYTSLTGANFASVPAPPVGYTLNYAYEGNKIALVQNTSTYAAWIAGFPGVGLLNGVADDPDFDGIDNGVEMVLGGDPATGMDIALMPTLELVTDPPSLPAGDYLLFTYRRTAISEAALVTAACETDTDLVAPWTPAVNAVSGVVIQEDLNFSFTPAAPANTDRVRVYVPRAANTTLFGRLDVVIP